jgi:hypothetical protein
MTTEQTQEKIRVFEKEFGTNKTTLGAFLFAFGEIEKTLALTQTQTNVLLAEIRDAVVDALPYLSRIAIATESIDLKTKEK